MTEASLPYEQWIDRAQRDVVKQALTHAAQHGFTGNHHFYITFRTAADGVQIAPHLRAQYPQEMTIVLQHQFWDLFVDEQAFSVTLRFGGQPERLTVPFEAMTAFADPVANFGLQLHRGAAAGQGPAQDSASEIGAEPGTAEPAVGDAGHAGHGESADGSASDEAENRGSGEVITLDTFRKK